jgi:hypothetical protein
MNARRSIIAAMTITVMALFGPAAAAAAPPQASPGLPALISGRAGSPVLNAMRSGKVRFNVDSSGAAPGTAAAPYKNRGRYKVLIVDGDNLSARGLASQAAVQHFLDSGRWVLALDLGHGHFRRAIKRLTGFKGVANSRVFLFRRTVVDGTPTVQMLNAPRLLPREAGGLPQATRQQVIDAEANRVDDMIHATLTTEGANLPGEVVPGAAASGIPDELQHVNWSYTVTGSTTLPHGYWWQNAQREAPIFHVPSAGSQTASWTMTHSFDVYLDNGNGKPQGNNEIVTYNLDGEFSPKLPDQTFSQMFNGFWVGFNEKPGLPLERAWWTGMIGDSVDPNPETEDALVWQASEPQTPNEETEYTSGDEFEVGFSGSNKGAEISGSYKWSSEKTNKIPDWGVENEGNGDRLDWLFSSRNGCDVRPGTYSDTQCFNVGAFKDGTPNLPPDLSRGQVQVHTSARWKTKGLLSPDHGELSFNVATPITLVDTYCEPWHAFDVSCARRKHTTKLVGPPSQTYAFDANAVVPIPVEAVLLTPNPANGAKDQEVVGTVVLKRPAAMDTNVIIFSDSPNAAVGAPEGRGSRRTIRIPKGSTTGTFKVQTNDNGLKPGEHVTANVTAFYAEPTTATLRIESPTVSLSP